MTTEPAPLDEPPLDGELGGARSVEPFEPVADGPRSMEPAAFYFAASAAAYVRAKLALQDRSIPERQLFERPFSALEQADLEDLIRIGQAAGFEWLRAMAGCAQEAEYHAEGDVLVHTRMVVDALVASPEWRSAPAAARSELFAAALLHDVAKPRCTRVEEDGRIHARGHARLGARMARALLWSDEAFLREPVPIAHREAVVSLVRLHGLPLYVLDDADPRYALFRASIRVRCDRLALLAEADVRGRQCTDQQGLVDRVELFRLLAAEQRCLDQPRHFASDHSRFLYFRRPQRDPEHAAHDPTRFEVTLLSGLPGAGKDTYARRYLSDLPQVSLDLLRRSMRISPEETQKPVIDAAQSQARAYLRSEQPFVWNSTNISTAMRAPLIDLFAAHGARIRVVYVDAPLPELLRRNARRAETVPAAVVQRLADRLEIPDRTEAHHVEWVSGLAP